MFNISVPVSWYLAGVLGIAVAVSGAGWAHTSNKLEAERTAHQETKDNHEQIVQGFKDAQELADQKAEAKRKEIEKEAKREAEEADKRYNDLYAKYRSNLVRYQQASQGDRSGPDSGEVRTTESGYGPGGGAEFPTVLISFKDADICAVNTARLQVVRDWALKYQQSD